MSSLAEIREALRCHRPTVVEAPPAQRAEVAIVLRDNTASLDLLLIERAIRDGDPWSGHMAFPGGRVSGGDVTPRSAAERETLEEVGLSLAGAESLGRLDDLHGFQSSTRQLVISAFVFHIVDPDPLTPNEEVKEAFWFPFDGLRDSQRHVDHRIEQRPGMRAPGILVGEPDRHVIWGLTYRFLEDFLKILGHTLPQRWDAFSSSG
jgi:8-oxo-dGTP pyrophosphatase MutT (NUDIX family)